ncbi:endoribonuclease L-PSP family protein [Janthinobacterium agaricidamnosum NBRC 102515 = DSM 9628]|uniref:Endoribonuclease L-PSP family protein n=1 Tax=Janthinobacterium agaricidamnosum NBRC 102515 = DSM 9628 TaxID=1349767 RepID=W0V685_9BURK|nr:endoribonuclease L-PSP family protein [Janthinobacterium agaricidamnosum NBRC 102515 = DSM 9628]
MPAGHYAPAIIHDQLVYMSGTLPLGLSTHAPTPDSSFEAQLRQLLANCDAVLHAAGSATHKVISFTLYLTELGDWDAADQLLADFFGEHRPSRSVICVPRIRKGYAVQATLIAAL